MARPIRKKIPRPMKKTARAKTVKRTVKKASTKAPTWESLVKKNCEKGVDSTMKFEGNFRKHLLDYVENLLWDLLDNGYLKKPTGKYLSEVDLADILDGDYRLSDLEMLGAFEVYGWNDVEAAVVKYLRKLRGTAKGTVVGYHTEEGTVVLGILKKISEKETGKLVSAISKKNEEDLQGDRIKEDRGALEELFKLAIYANGTDAVQKALQSTLVSK